MNPSSEPAVEHEPGAPYAWAEPPPQPPRRPWSRTLAVAGLTAVALAVAGGPFGLLWHAVAPTVPVLNAGEGRIVIQSAAPEQYVAADGWFALLGFPFGVLAAIAAWMVLRRHRGPFLVLGVTVGLLAAALAAWQAGRLIGRGAWQSWQESSAAGATYQAPADLHAYGTLLVPAFAAVIVLTLLAGWSNDPNLDLPGLQPGYGHDLDDRPDPDSDGPDFTGRDFTGRDSAGPDFTGPDFTGRDFTGRDSAGPDFTDRDLTGRDSARRDFTGRDSAGRDFTGRDFAGRDLAGPETDGPDVVRTDAAAPGAPGTPGAGPPVSSGWPDGPDPTTAPAPPAPGPGAPPRA
ncbi:hypothetical protein [Jidongwangia harbinensis]|uniref:hypothetical protein n=1 Tax=Jidongwangia harbinensis TaxID=2878561 RepID=UPI001CD9393E|nr:hypothetical protein [Jidongwangia harbinensis]MCA2212372.1 hypothetical protein [Jidongwangia harbinensis]